METNLKYIQPLEITNICKASKKVERSHFSNLLLHYSFQIIEVSILKYKKTFKAVNLNSITSCKLKIVRLLSSESTPKKMIKVHKRNYQHILEIEATALKVLESLDYSINRESVCSLDTLIKELSSKKGTTEDFLKMISEYKKSVKLEIKTKEENFNAFLKFVEDRQIKFGVDDILTTLMKASSNL